MLIMNKYHHFELQKHNKPMPIMNFYFKKKFIYIFTNALFSFVPFPVSYIKPSSYCAFIFFNNADFIKYCKDFVKFGSIKFPFYK